MGWKRFAPSQEELVDAALEAYVSWRESCVEAAQCYGFWCTAAASELSVSYAAYCYALDQEETAAADYARALVGLRASLAEQAREIPTGSPTTAPHPQPRSRDGSAER